MDRPPDWTEPGAHPVALDVFRIPLPLPTDGLRAVNVYAIRTPDGLVMVDGGWALEESRRQLEWSLKELDAGLADVRRFLITHAHRDHYTQAAAIRREYGGRVSLGAGERPTLDGMAAPGATHGTPQLARLRRCGAGPVIGALLASGFDRPVDLSNWEPPDDWIEGSPTLSLGSRELLALPTPGHTRGHLVFADLAAGLLFSGDHVLPHITPSIGFEYAPPASPLADYLASLAAVRELPDLVMLPAHGPVTTSVHARIDELLRHHGQRLDACADAVATGAGTAYEVAHRLRWTRRERRLAELDTLNQMLAVLETIAHLDLLAAQHRLTATTHDGVAHYAVP